MADRMRAMWMPAVADQLIAAAELAERATDDLARAERERDSALIREAELREDVVAAQRALDALPPAQRAEIDRLAAGHEVPGHPVRLVGHEHAAIIDQALVYWDRDLTAPHAQIAEIRKLIGGGS